MAVCSFRTRHKGDTSGISTETLEKSGEAVCDSSRRSLMVVIRRPVRWWWLVWLSMALALIVFRDWDLAVAPHGVLGCQDERGEAGQRLGHLQEWMLQTDGESERGGKTWNLISRGISFQTKFQDKLRWREHTTCSARNGHTQQRIKIYHVGLRGSFYYFLTLLGQLHN